MEPSSKDPNGPFKTFREHYSGFDETTKDDFSIKVQERVRRRINGSDADDFAQDAFIALFYSSTFYPEIKPGLVVAKALELARAYWKRLQRRGPHEELGDGLADPGDDPLEVIQKREQLEATQSKHAQVRQIASLKQRKLIDDIVEHDRKLVLDKNKNKPLYRHGPECHQFCYGNIADNLNVPEKDVHDNLEALRKRLDRRGMMPKRSRKKKLHGHDAMPKRKRRHRRESTDTITP